MTAARIVLMVLILTGWVALWSVAVRVILGQHHDVAESALIDWLLVAGFAFLGPIMVADLIATQDWGLVESFLFQCMAAFPWPSMRSGASSAYANG